MPFGEDADSLVEELREVVSETLSEAADEEIREISLLQQDLHDDIAEFVWKKLRRRPLVLPVVVEVCTNLTKLRPAETEGGAVPRATLRTGPRRLSPPAVLGVTITGRLVSRPDRKLRASLNAG